LVYLQRSNEVPRLPDHCTYSLDIPDHCTYSLDIPDHCTYSLDIPDHCTYSLDKEEYISATTASNHCCHKLLYNDKLYLACSMQESKSRHEKQPTAVM